MIEEPETIFTYEEQLKKEEEGYYVKTCPSETPYTFNGDHCFNCTDQTPLFNITDKLCTQCEVGKEYYHGSYSCRKKYYLTDVTNEKLLFVDNYTS